MSTAGATLLTLIRACEGPTCGHCRRGLMLTRGLDWCPQHHCRCGHVRGAHDQPRWDTDCVECTSCTGFIPARSARRLTNQGELIMLKNLLRKAVEAGGVVASAIAAAFLATVVVMLGWVVPVAIVGTFLAAVYLTARLSRQARTVEATSAGGAR